MRTGLVLLLAVLTLFSGALAISRPGTAPALSARVVRFAIDARLDPREKTIAGSERLTWRNASSDPVGRSPSRRCWASQGSACWRSFFCSRACLR